MKISINTDPSVTETEITINCSALTPEINDLIAALRMMDNRLTVTKGEESIILDISSIAYIESVDRRTFVYTADECYETKMKLYEMEERLCGIGFMRISRSCLVRLRFIRSIKAEFDRKLRLTLENGEQMIVSRQYADELKQRLGVR
ncbi:MAG: LytTR family transcriptional regulator DNA-binding domain-containing protein [Oscillospiraceae bacterium]|nr:LytTR family transcriptional regulator DNA-binding domain-containing protein [Oscillospiraceae bacterium]